MTGYLGDPERNAAVMAGGYYHTGDVASRDADGYITYIGRTDVNRVSALDATTCAVRAVVTLAGAGYTTTSRSPWAAAPTVSR